MPEANGSAHRKHDDGSSTRAFTVEQKAAVLRVRKCKATDFYDILGLEEVRSSCSDAEIKKAYRKLSLLTHPDKNGYTGADEAFKMVSRAFQILSDAEKKSKYDKYGVDPDNRFSSASASGASPFSGFASQRSAGRPQGPMFEEEISPEDLFRQFFGGGGGGGFGGGFGGPFGGMGMGGPGFVFNVGGGPGIRVHQFGGNRPQRRPHNHENREPASVWQAIQGLLPLLLLFLIPLLSNLFSDPSSTGPSVSFEHNPPYTQQHTSNRLSVPYWVQPSDVKDYSRKSWAALDKRVENSYLSDLGTGCERERNVQLRLMNDARGFFTTDREMLERARNMDLPSCQTLKSLGYQTSSY